MQRPTGRMLLGAAARFVGFVVISCIVAFLGGLILGGLLHEGTRRGIAIGFYITGMALAGAGFLLGSRPPVRSRSEKDPAEPHRFGLGGHLSGRGVRWATRDELHQAMNLPAILIAVGITLVVIGAVVDGRHTT